MKDAAEIDQKKCRSIFAVYLTFRLFDNFLVYPFNLQKTLSLVLNSRQNTKSGWPLFTKAHFDDV